MVFLFIIVRLFWCILSCVTSLPEQVVMPDLIRHAEFSDAVGSRNQGVSCKPYWIPSFGASTVHPCTTSPASAGMTYDVTRMFMNS